MSVIQFYWVSKFLSVPLLAGLLRRPFSPPFSHSFFYAHWGRGKGLKTWDYVARAACSPNEFVKVLSIWKCSYIKVLCTRCNILWLIFHVSLIHVYTSLWLFSKIPHVHEAIKWGWERRKIQSSYETNVRMSLWDVYYSLNVYCYNTIPYQTPGGEICSVTGSWGGWCWCNEGCDGERSWC